MRYGATRHSRRGGVYGGWRSSRLATVRIVRDVLLTGAGHAEGVRRNVLGDDAARCRPRAIPDLDRRDERGVHARPHVRADLRAVLGLAVVVGGDVARADVRVLADVAVADVGQVRDLRAAADRRVLDLHEGSGLGVGPQLRVRSQVGEGPDRPVVLDRRLHEVGVRDGNAVAERGVDDRRLRADQALLADAGGALDRRAGLDRRVAPDRDVDVDQRRLRIDDRDPVARVALVDPALGDLADLRELPAVVDAERERVVGDQVRGDLLPGRAQLGEHIGQVELA